MDVVLNSHAASSPYARRALQRFSHRVCVLIVDGHASTLAHFAVCLRRAGLNVETAASGTEALEMTAAFVPDVIVLDDRLKQPSGQDVIDALRLRRPTAAVPTVLFTSASAAGAPCSTADVCLAKPCPPVELLAVIRLLATRA